jgi:tetratricopeptide (TPR) repeat protein
MRIALSPGRRTLLLAASSAVVLAYLAFSLTDYLAACFAQRTDLASLQRAVRLQPWNAEYRDRLGRHFFFQENSPDNAIRSYLSAVSLNPHQPRYWVDLANAYQVQGSAQQESDALERALRAGPTSTTVAWDAANLYAVMGDTGPALQRLRIVLEHDPYLPPAALQLCWRIKPDIDVLLRDVVPPIATVNTSFLEFLTSRKETESAARVWTQLAALLQPVERRYVFDYMRYLIGRQEVDQARLVWEQAANLSGLAAYQPSPENLIVNGDFSLSVLNGGFDWLYRQSSDVSFALDPTQSHAGHRSLLINFDARALEDAGIHQLITVQPNEKYDFSAFFKADDIQGAGGPRLAIQDLYTGRTYFSSDDLKDSTSWKQVSGMFTTGSETKLLIFRVQRVPARSPIRGKLWIDDLRLVQTKYEGS